MQETRHIHPVTVWVGALTQNLRSQGYINSMSLTERSKESKKRLYLINLTNLHEVCASQGISYHTAESFCNSSLWWALQGSGRRVTTHRGLSMSQTLHLQQLWFHTLHGQGFIVPIQGFRKQSLELRTDAFWVLTACTPCCLLMCIIPLTAHSCALK